MAANDIAAWLRELGLERYSDAFRANDIDLEILSELSEPDLERLGVSLGHRKRVLKAIASLGAADLAGSPAAQAAIRPAAPVEREAERRQVTVLFCDLAGFTALTHDLGAEAVHALTDRFFERADGIIERYGGTIDKHIGDCVMAVFGAPRAHGNDPERAIRAALEIRTALPELSPEFGREIRAHIGIASGQVVASEGAGHRSYSITGHSVNLASCLTDAAEPGAILIAEAVRGPLAERLECAPVGSLTVKGLAEPVNAWRLEGLRAAAGAPDRPFVGRRVELAQFEAILQTCLEAGTGHAIHLRGEAGIGKTRLVEEFQSRAVAAGFASHIGLVLDFGAGTGRDAIRALVRSLLGISDSHDPAALESTVERAVAAGLIAPDQRVYLNDLLDLTQPTELASLYDAMDNPTRNRGQRATVAALIQAESRRQPTVLVVEDLHWADPLTLDHLTTLVEMVTTGPVILIMTTRLEGDPFDRAWRSGLGGGSILTIDLGPLRPQEAASLAEAYFEANSEWAKRCVERAAGNPLFLEQLLRHAEGSSEAGVPGSVQSLVQARMDRLEPADRLALQAASILGQQFSLNALRHLIENPGYACTGLIAHFLVRPQAKGFLFAHALIREGVYESLLQARRRELHRRAAHWYAGQDAVLRAEHLERAEEPEAASAFAEAALAEAKGLRYEPALRMAERGLALAQATDGRVTLTMLRAEYLREIGRAKDSIATFREALGLTADEMIRCRAWIGVAAGVRLLGGDAEGLEALDQAEPLARRHQADRELARIGYYRGCLLFASGEVDACVRQHEQAAAAAVRAGDPEWEAWTLSGLGDAHYARGRMRLALEDFRRCQALCHQHGLGRVEVGSTHMIGVTRRYLNEFREAIDDLRAAASMAAKVGNTRTELAALFILGELLTDHGELEGAYAHLDRGLAITDALGNRKFRVYVLYELGRALWHDERRRSEAERVLGEALSLSREVGMTFLGPRVLAAAALATDSGAARRAALDEGEAIVRAGCLAHVGLWFYRDAIEASLSAADWAGAERYADALEAFTQPEPLPWSDFFIARGRFLAAIGKGERDGRTRLQLERLLDEARRLELLTALPAMERALAGF